MKTFGFASVLSIKLFFQATCALLILHEKVLALFYNVFASPVFSCSTCVFLPGTIS